jgi:threonine dehydrogenase-like Zn-dependent dehydrogenase
MAADHPSDLIPVPAALAEFAILVEPMSVVEKAVTMALSLAQRPIETALVMGAGTIGLLAAAVLRKHARRVIVRSIEPRGHYRARLAERLGAEYHSEAVPGVEADIAIEAAGATAAADAAIRALSWLGVAVLLGGPPGDVRVPMREAVLKNLTVAGSVNADPDSFRAAVDDLVLLDRAALDGMIERRHFRDLLRSMEEPLPEAPKIVHLWD